jgi:chemotaxis protein MotB
MSRRRRHRQAEEHPNHERWLVSYADFITLLFAFFVVMYAISSVNEGKYRVLSNTLTEAFRETTRSLNPIQIGEPTRSGGVMPGDTLSQSAVQTGVRTGPETLETPPATPADPGFDAVTEARREGARRLGYLAATLESVLGALVEQEQVSVAHTGEWVEVTMKSALLFPSGSAALSDSAKSILRDISQVLRPLPNPIHVEGYTDDVPISTGAFPSNWELSAARAASVVHLFTRFGVDPRRLAAVGYGEFRPIADNVTEDGRRANRRVSLVIGAVTGDPGRGVRR